MLAFHMMNQNARAKVFPRTTANGIGTLLMFVVRSLFSRPGRLQETMRGLAARAACRKRSPRTTSRSVFWSTRVELRA